MPVEEIFDVIIIGAGLSGLTSANVLRTFGIKLIVLEARNRVGGRTYTKQCAETGSYVDLGGSYVGPTQNRILNLAKELGVQTYMVNVEGKSLILHNSKLEDIYGEAFSSPWNILEYLDINNLYRKIDAIGIEIPIDAPWNARNALSMDRTTYQQFIDDTCFTKKGKAIAKFIVNINMTAEPYESSLLWVLWYIRQCGGIKRIMATSNGAQERKFHGGSQQISSKLADKLNENLHLNEPVCLISQLSELVEVKATTGRSWKGKFVILAVPPAMQLNIHYEPSLPAERHQMCQRMPMGSIIKAILYYKEPFWRKEGYSGELFIFGDDKHPAISVFDDTKPDGSAPSLVLFICAEKCRTIFEKSKVEREQIIKQSLFDMFSTKEVFQSYHYEEFNWCTEQYSGGAYTAIYGPGLLTTLGKNIRKPYGRIHFAGTETASKWSGYMDGAVEAGERAAREVLHAMNKITKNEIHQEPPIYVELPFQNVIPTYFERFFPSVQQLRKGFFTIISFSGIFIIFLTVRKNLTNK